MREAERALRPFDLEPLHLGHALAQVVLHAEGQRDGRRRTALAGADQTHLDDAVFLAAAITRLVIDPYREECAMDTTLGRGLNLKLPFLFTGFEEAPPGIREALAAALKSSGSAYIGLRPLADDVPWLQLMVNGKNEPQAGAAGLLHVVGRRFKPPVPITSPPPRESPRITPSACSPRTTPRSST